MEDVEKVEDIEDIEEFRIELGDKQNPVVIDNREDFINLVCNMTKVDKFVVSYSRRVNDGNYNHQDIFNSGSLDFSSFWSMVSDKDLADPDKSALIQELFAEGAFRRVGLLTRSLYKSVLYPTYEWASSWGTPFNSKLRGEIQAIQRGEGFDPFNVLGKK